MENEIIFIGTLQIQQFGKINKSAYAGGTIKNQDSIHSLCRNEKP